MDFDKQRNVGEDRGLKTVLRKARTLVSRPKPAISGKLIQLANTRAKRRLVENGVWQLLASGRDDEFPADPFDLCNIHDLIRKRKPKDVLEFGVGFSTIVIAHTLYENHKDALQKDPDAKPGKVWSINASAEWVENTKKKMPEHLRMYSIMTQSQAETCIQEGELCHVFAELPNIKPEFIYLDGPAPREVSGSVRGLSYVLTDGGARPPMSADILLLESSLPPSAFILIDGREKNMRFLRRNLKRNYRFRWHKLLSYSTFELIEDA